MATWIMNCHHSDTHAHSWMYNPSCYLFCCLWIVIGLRSQIDAFHMFPTCTYDDVSNGSCVVDSIPRYLFQNKSNLIISKHNLFSFMIFVRYKYNFQNVWLVLIQITFAFCHTLSLCRLNHICLNSFYIYVHLCMLRHFLNVCLIWNTI